METVRDFIFLGFKITADGDCSHEMKRCLLLGRKAMKNLDSVLKSRDITLLTKCLYSQGYGFPVVMYRCESWTIKKTEHWRINAFKLWCWRRLFRVLWIARKSNLLVLKEINPEYSLEGLRLKLKLQCFGQLKPRANSLEKTLVLGKIEGRRENGMTEDEMIGWHHLFNEHEFEQTLGDNEGQRSLACCRSWGHEEPDTTEDRTTTVENSMKVL